MTTARRPSLLLNSLLLALHNHRSMGTSEIQAIVGSFCGSYFSETGPPGRSPRVPSLALGTRPRSTSFDRYNDRLV